MECVQQRCPLGTCAPEGSVCTQTQADGTHKPSVPFQRDAADELDPLVPQPAQRPCLGLG